MVQIGTIKREPYTMYYVDGTGAVMKFPAKGHKGTKGKVAQFKRPAGCLCYVDGKGAVLCKKR